MPTLLPGLNTRRLQVSLGLTLAGLASGCIQRNVNGDTSFYRVQTWMIFVSIVGGLAVPFVGWLVHRLSARLGYGLLALGLVFLFLLLPSIILDSVTVDSRHFERAHWFWWTPTRNDLQFDDLSEIKLHVEEKLTRHGKRRDSSLEFIHKSGGSDRIALGGLMEAAAVEILSRAKAKGVRITNLNDRTID